MAMDRIEALYQQNFKTVYWAAYGILHDRERAEDAVQSVFMKALRNSSLLARLSDPQARAWLHTAVRNECIDSLRKLRPEYLVEEVQPEALGFDGRAMPEDAVLRREQAEDICRMVDSLPEKYRAPIFMYYFAELPQGDIAAALGLNESTLRSIMRRGKAMLHKYMLEGGLLYE